MLTTAGSRREMVRVSLNMLPLALLEALLQHTGGIIVAVAIILPPASPPTPTAPTKALDEPPLAAFAMASLVLCCLALAAEVAALASLRRHVMAAAVSDEPDGHNHGAVEGEDGKEGEETRGRSKV